MKIVIQIVFILFMVLFLIGTIGEKEQKGRIFCLITATIMAAMLIATSAVL